MANARSNIPTKEELTDLIIADIALSIAFSIILGFKNFIYYFPMALIAVTVSFILHEYMHKISAQRFGAVVVRYKELEITGEFNQLEKIYRVMPESTAIPICLVTFRNNVVGYLAENVSGTPFLSLKRDKRVKYLNECVIPVIYKLHQNNIGHGDILVGNSEGGGNIFIVENGIKLIDPLPGYKGITDKERIEFDIENIRRVLS